MSVVIFSGGMDSTVLLAYELDQSHPVEAISFNYGQRHARELASAKWIAERLGVNHEVVDLTNLRPLLAGSSLTDDSVAVPDGHYAEESMRATIVPNRNAIMLSIATGWAVSRGHEWVKFGAHAGDHFIYPDCRPPFIYAMDLAVRLANDGVAEVGIDAPFRTMSKTAIAKLGAKLNAPVELSWSCYKGGDVHCGTCGTCTERIEAFTDAGVPDPTIYATQVTASS